MFVVICDSDTVSSVNIKPLDVLLLILKENSILQPSWSGTFSSSFFFSSQQHYYPKHVLVQSSLGLVIFSAPFSLAGP